MSFHRINFSIQNSLASFISVWKRFPVTLSAAYIATIYLMFFISDFFDKDDINTKNIIVIAMAAIWLLLARVTLESHRVDKLKSGIIYFIVVTIIAAYYFFLPADLENASYCNFWLSIGLYILALLLLSIIPYLFIDRSIISFRSYNYKLFLNIVTALFYGLILFSTLALALLALDELFGIDISGNTYSKLFTFLSGIFVTTYFLSDYPKDYDDEIYERTQGLKVLGEYIMIPILFIYGIILYAYVVKLLMQSAMPLPWVRYMIICFLVLGVFTYLINYFVKNEVRRPWTKVFLKLFFPLSIPLAFLLIYSVYDGVSTEGITDGFYLNGLIGIWILLLSLYIIISKKDDLKFIPVSLTIIVFIAFFSPINICTMIVNSQYDRALNYLSKHGFIKDGVLTKSNNLTTIDQEFYSSIDYLEEYKALNKIKSIDKNNILGDTTISRPHLLNVLNISDNQYYDTRLSDNILEINSPYGQVYDVDGYDEIIPLATNEEELLNQKKAFLDLRKSEFQIWDKKDIIARYDLQIAIDTITNKSSFLELSSDVVDTKFYIQNMNISQNKSGNRINYTSGIVLIRIKK